MTPEQGMTSAHFIYIPCLLIVGVIITDFVLFPSAAIHGDE